MADSHYLFPMVGGGSSWEASSSIGSSSARGGGGGGTGTGGQAAGAGSSARMLVPAAVFAVASLGYFGVRYALVRNTRRGGAAEYQWADHDARRAHHNARRGSRTPTPQRHSDAHALAERAAAAAARRTPQRGPSPAPVRSPPAAGGFVPSGTGAAGHSPLSASPPAAAAGGVPSTSTSKWIKGQRLGGGTFGEVFLGRHVKTGQMAAIKEMRRVEDERECEKEFALLRNLRHDFVVAIYGVEHDRGAADSVLGPSHGHMRLIMEYCPNGCLSDILRRDGPVHGEPLLRSYARQILLGLQFLHQHNILHRDIKPANILIDSKGWLKLTDFGMSRHMDTMHSRTALAGSPAYMSPEAIEGRYFVGTDLWAVGATLSQMATGQTPWAHVADRDLRNPHALMHYICVGPLSPGAPKEKFEEAIANHHPVIPEWLSDEGKDFMKRLFAFDHKDRGTADQLLAHPWLVNGGPSPVTVATCFQFTGDGAPDSDEDTSDMTTRRGDMSESRHSLDDSLMRNSGRSARTVGGSPVAAVPPARKQQQQRPVAATPAVPVDPLDVEVSGTTTSGNTAAAHPPSASATATGTATGTGTSKSHGTAASSTGGPAPVVETQEGHEHDDAVVLAHEGQSSPSDGHRATAGDTPSSHVGGPGEASLRQRSLASGASTGSLAPHGRAGEDHPQDAVPQPAAA